MFWLDDLEDPEDPLFPVQRPDGVTDWPERKRQARFMSQLRYRAPALLKFAVPNAGRRSPAQVRGEGLLAGVFDVCAIEHGSLFAFVEFKGYDARGYPGQLTEQQIRFGNRCVRLGVPAATFFCPYAAIEWLTSLGFTIGPRTDARATR